MIIPKQIIDFKKSVGNTFWSAEEVVIAAFSMLQQHCHAASYNRGWWHDPVTGLSLIPGSYDAEMRDHELAEQMRAAWFPYVVATKIALIHSEVSEMLEAHRCDLDDDKIPFAGITAESADTVIRICDLLGMLSETNSSPMGRAEDYNLGEAIMAKIPFNGVRPDHALEARAKPGGKKY